MKLNHTVLVLVVSSSLSSPCPSPSLRPGDCASCLIQPCAPLCSGLQCSRGCQSSKRAPAVPPTASRWWRWSKRTCQSGTSRGSSCCCRRCNLPARCLWRESTKSRSLRSVLHSAPCLQVCDLLDLLGGADEALKPSSAAGHPAPGESANTTVTAGSDLLDLLGGMDPVTLSPGLNTHIMLLLVSAAERKLNCPLCLRFTLAKSVIAIVAIRGRSEHGTSQSSINDDKPVSSFYCNWCWLPGDSSFPSSVLWSLW